MKVALVQMAPFALWEDQEREKEEWKSATTISGEQYVIIDGTTLMLPLLVGS